MELELTAHELLNLISTLRWRLKKLDKMKEVLFEDKRSVNDIQEEIETLHGILQKLK